MNRADCAEAYFKEGYNCAQAVLAACHDELGLDKETALKIASSFGAGMGRMREVCGAVTGLFMAAGGKYGYLDPNDRDGKDRQYQLVQDLAARFQEHYGSILCRDLVILPGQASDPAVEIGLASPYQRKPCVEYVRYAASLLDQLENE